MQAIHYSAQVEGAMRENRPIVALESTLITHGLAWPRNLETAQQIEQAVRESAAQPATIAVLAGQITVGLTDVQLTALAQGSKTRKCSVRDLGIVTGMGLDGSTTVAATMFIAS